MTTSTILVFPIGASKCAPVQHFINVVSAILLGPGYALINAFLISLIRFMLGTGSLLAFPGSMIGALMAGILFCIFKKDLAAFAGEVFGTSVLGGICAFFVAKLFMSNDTAALFTYVLPFFHKHDCRQRYRLYCHQTATAYESLKRQLNKILNIIGITEVLWITY